MGIFVITIACRKVPFIIWIEVQRVQPCQSRGTCANTVHPASQFTDPVFRPVQLASIYGIRTGRGNIPGSYIDDLVSAIIQPVFIEGDFLTGRTVLDRHSTRRYRGVSHVDSGSIDRRDVPGICRNRLRRNRIQSFQIFGKPHFQVITAIRYHADIVFR